MAVQAAPLISPRIDAQRLLAGQGQQVAAEQVIQAVIEPHGFDGCDDAPVLHPKGGKAGHAGQAGRAHIRIVQVPQVTDVQAGSQFAQHVATGQFAGGHDQRVGHFPAVGTIGLQAVFSGRARADQLPDQLSGLDQVDVLACCAVRAEAGLKAGGRLFAQADQGG